MRRLHYGWVVVGVGFTAAALAGGLSGSFPVFIKPWSEDFGWGVTSISLAVTIYLLVGASLAPVGGSLADRFGTGPVLAVFVLSLAIGSLGLAAIHSRWQLYLFFGLFIGMESSLGPIFTPLLVRWFSQQRGLGFSLVAMGSHVGTAVVALTSVALLAVGGMRLPWLVYGLAALVLIPVVYLLLRRRPPTEHAGGERKLAVVGATFAEARRTRSFWMIIACSAVCGYSTRTFWLFVVPAGIEGGATPALAASALSLASIMNVPGLLTSGFAVDRISRQRWLATLFGIRLLSLAGVVLFLLNGQLPVLFVSVILAGFSSRATDTVFQSLLVNCYGVRSLGRLYGIQIMAHQVAAAISAVVGGLIRDATGSYVQALLIGVGSLVVGIVVGLMIQERRSYAIQEAAPEAVD